MSAFIGYSFGLLEPGATVGIYLHGFPADQFSAIDVRARRTSSRPGAFVPSIIVDSRVAGEATDGTLAHTIWVTNVSESQGAAPLPFVDVAVFFEPLQ